MKRNKLLMALVVLLMASCGGGSSSNSTSYDNKSYVPNTGQQIQMLTCPMCNGTGIFYLIPGDFMSQQPCGACGGKGICDANTAQQVMEAIQQVNSIIGGSGGYNQGGRGRSIAEIEYDLRKAYDQLRSLEDAYNNCSSGVLRTQYPQMISDQRERIRQLEYELRNTR